MTAVATNGYRILGQAKVEREFTEAHCRRLAQWFAPDGRFAHFGTPPSSRERLWNCFSLLRHGDETYRQLAEAIILATPVDANHFEPIAAVEVWLRHRERLSAAANAHLVRIVREHLLNMHEVRFGGPGTNNFTCMTTWFLLAASQMLETYEFKHEHASIPCVYTDLRLRTAGLNALRALAHHAEHEPVFSEFNSPTYTPISLHALAKIVELCTAPTARALALEIELKLWREVLSFYHPFLGLSCGPYGRAYRCDILGQNSQMRILFCYTGISKDRSLVELFDEQQPGLIFHHDGDIPFTWSGPAWQLANRYHVPEDALVELRDRVYPKRTTAPVFWDGFGHINPATGRYISVQGHLFPPGAGTIVQTQYPRYAVGYRNPAKLGHSFPLQFHYPLKRTVRTMRDVRNVTAATLLYGAPIEWVPDQAGKPMEASNFNNAGTVEIEEGFGLLAFRAHAFAEFAALPADEVSLNTFIPVHFAAVDSLRLNETVFTDQPLEITAREAVLTVRDAGVEYSLRYKVAQPARFRLWRWANFIRFAVFLYSGPSRTFSAAELTAMAATGDFRLIAAP